MAARVQGPWPGAVLFARRRRAAVRLDPTALVDWASVVAQVGEGAWPNSRPRPSLWRRARGRAREARTRAWSVGRFVVLGQNAQ